MPQPSEPIQGAKWSKPAQTFRHSQAVDSNTPYFSLQCGQKRGSFQPDLQSLIMWPRLWYQGKWFHPPPLWGEGGWKNWENNPVFLLPLISLF